MSDLKPPNWVLAPWNKINKKHARFRINRSTSQTHPIGNWSKNRLQKKRSERHSILRYIYRSIPRYIYHSIPRYILLLCIDTRTPIQCSKTWITGPTLHGIKELIKAWLMWARNVEDNRKVGNRIAEGAGLRPILFNVARLHNTPISSKNTSKQTINT